MNTKLSAKDKALLAYVFGLATRHLDDLIENWSEGNKNGEFDGLIKDIKTNRENADKLFYRLFNNKE